MWAGCSEEPAHTPVPPAKKAVAAKPKPQPEPEAAVVEPEKKEPQYVYDSTGRRDPFEPLLVVKRPVLESGEPLTPLQKYDLHQLRLIGVIVGKGAPKAMVIAPGGKSFILKRGVKVGKNNGTIVDITEDAILVEERYYDFAGEIRKNVQAIELPKREGVN